MRNLGAFRTALPVIIGLALAGPAHAQRAEADAAFQRGRALMARGETAKACTEFETSMQLDPQRGTLYNLALCHEQLGKIASAWSEFKELAATDKNAPRQKDAAKRAARLERQLTRMRLVVRQPVDGLVVKRGDLDITALAGDPVPVDPGRYTFVATAPGKRPARLEIDLSRPGATIEVTIPALDAEQKRTSSSASGAGSSPALATWTTDAFALRRTLRPVALPRRVVEATAAVRLRAKANNNPGRVDPIESLLAVRAGLGPVQLRAGLSLHTRYETQDYRPAVVENVEVAADYVISPLIAAGASYSREHPYGRRALGTYYRANLARKYIVSPKLAFVAGGSIVYDVYDPSADSYGPDSEFGVVGVGSVELGFLDQLTFELDASVRLNLSGGLYGQDDDLLITVGAGAYFALSTHMDVFLLARQPTEDAAGRRAFVLGVNRRFP